MDLASVYKAGTSQLDVVLQTTGLRMPIRGVHSALTVPADHWPTDYGSCHSTTRCRPPSVAGFYICCQH